MKPDTPAIKADAGASERYGSAVPSQAKPSQEQTDAPAREKRFLRLYRAHLDAVVAYVVRRGLTDSVDDVVSETFLAAWVNFDKMPRTEADQLPWLLVAARHALLNRSRSDRRRVVLSARLALEPRYPVEGPASEAIDPILAAALRALPAPDRELLCLLAWDALDRQQAAKVLECSPTALRLRLMRARRRLEKELSRMAAEQESK